MNCDAKTEESSSEYQKSTASSTPSPLCHQPSRLPLRVTSQTRVAFAYDLVSMVFCLDASPTLTSSLGSMNMHMDDGFICPVDRLGMMVRTYFSALIRPVDGSLSPGVLPSHGEHDNVNPPPNDGDVLTKKKNPKKGKLFSGSHAWSPEIAVTVIAVYPHRQRNDHNTDDSYESMDRTTSTLLVRDYRVRDLESATTLSDMISFLGHWRYRT